MEENIYNMARWRYDENGNKIHISKFDLKGIATIKTLFPRGREHTKRFLFLKNPKINAVSRDCRFGDALVLIKHIFMHGFTLMLERVAKGDIYLLENSTGSHILLEPYAQKEVEALRRRGAYKDVDMIKTQWRLPKFVFRLRPNKITGEFDRRISPTRKIAKIATTALENGTINFDKLID